SPLQTGQAAFSVTGAGLAEAAIDAVELGVLSGCSRFSNSRNKSITARSRVSGGLVKYTCAQRPRFSSSNGFNSGFRSAFGCSPVSGSSAQRLAKGESPKVIL